MITYLLVLTLHATLVAPFELRGVAPDTLLDGSLAYRRVLLASGPRQAAVQLLEANAHKAFSEERWTGELYRVEVENRALRAVQLPLITAVSDTFDIEIEGAKGKAW